MGQLDNQPENPGEEIPKSTEAMLRSVTQDLERLKQNVLEGLSEDVARLQAQKANLQREIEDLQSQRQQQQVVQQQVLLRQMAQNLAAQLQEQILQQMDRGVDSQSSSSAASSLPAANSQSLEHRENAYRLLAAIDSTLRATFDNLQQDLNSYRSSLSQQLRHMHSLEQQGELILESLVNRLRRQLQNGGAGVAAPLEFPELIDSSYELPPSFAPPSPSLPPEAPIKPESEPTPSVIRPATPPQPAASVQLGFVIIIAYAVLLSLFNVVVSIIQGKPKTVLGIFENVGGFVQTSFGNSLLILWLRMLVVVPVMFVLARALYPKVFQDIRKFGRLSDPQLVIKVLASGFFLFLSQVLIYVALGDISPGVAITVFFVYPIVTVLSAWFLFGDRPSTFRLIVTAVIFGGVVLISLPASGIAVTDTFVRGLITAVASGITFAFYVLLTQASAKKLHPVPFSLINFIVILVCTCICLMLLPSDLPKQWSVNVNPAVWSSLIWSGIILGALTLASYLLNNIGISMVGAAKASLLGSSGPVLTALFAYLIIGRSLSLQQGLGMLIVTAGVTALSLEKMFAAPKPSR